VTNANGVLAYGLMVIVRGQSQMNEVCFKNLDKKQCHSLEVYEKSGGYKIWRKILKGNITPEE
jgi:NADH:ubiquinone oxidoreductase subunit F (NADH-binding)